MIWAAAVLGSVIALPLAVLLAMGRRVPALGGLLPGGVVLAAAVVQHLRLASTSGLSQVPVPRSVPTMAQRLAGLDGDLTWTGIAIALPVGVLLVGCAIGGVRAKRKRAVNAVLGVLLVLTWSGGFFRDVLQLHPRAQLTGVLVGVVLGLVAVVGLLGSDPEDHGPEAAGVAGIAYATALVGIAIGFRAAETAQLYAVLATVPAEDARRLFAEGQALGFLLEGRGWLTLAWGSAFALVGLGTQAVGEQARRVGAGLGALALPVLIACFSRTTTQPVWADFLRQLDDRVTAPPGRDYQLPVAEEADPIGLNSTLRVSRRQVFLDGTPIAALQERPGADGTPVIHLDDTAAVEQAVRQLVGRYQDAPFDRALSLAVDRRLRFETLLDLIGAAQAGGASRFELRVYRAFAIDGAVPLPIDPAPDPTRVDGHDPYPLRLRLLPDQVHLFVREQRIELDCLGTCEEPGFATSVLTQLAEAEPGEPEVLVIPYRDQPIDALTFWLTAQPEGEPQRPLLASRIVGTKAWIPEVVEPPEPANP